MREDSLQYHARVVEDFYIALVKGEHGGDEAVNVLLSSRNLLNEGVRYPLMKKEADRHLRALERRIRQAKEEKEREVNIPEGSRRSYLDEARAVTARSTKTEPARKAQHEAIPLFNRQQWEKAHEDGMMGKIDDMLRLYTGFRFTTRPNYNDYDKEEITHPHHPIHALNIFPSYDSTIPSYHSQPLIHKLMRRLFTKGGGKGSNRFNALMKKAAKKIHKGLRKDTLLPHWRGDNFDINTMFKIGYEDFLKDYGARFNEDDPTVKRHHFVWCKKWENEGLPRKYIFDTAFDDDGFIKADAHKVLHDAVKNDNTIQTDDGWVKPSAERIGHDALFDGTYMLPNDMIRSINYWKLSGAKDPKELRNIIGNNYDDALGYMALHNLVMKSALNRMYSGGSFTRGTNHTVANRALKDSAQRKQIERSADAYKDRLEKDILRNIKGTDDFNSAQVEQALGALDFTAAAEQFAKKKGLEIIGHGRYPNIVEDDFFGDNGVHMTYEIPDMKALKKAGFFQTNEGRDLNELFAHKLAHLTTDAGLVNSKMESLNDFHFTHSMEDWSDPADAVAEQTFLGFVMDAMGGGSGNMEYDFVQHLMHLRERAFRGMFFEPQDQINFQMPYRQAGARQLGTRKGTVSGYSRKRAGGARERLRDTYKPKKEGEENSKALNQTNVLNMQRRAREYGYDEETIEQLTERFNDTTLTPQQRTVVLNIPSVEDPKGRLVERFGMGDIDEFMEGTPQLMRVNSDSLVPFFGSEVDYMSDPMDETSMLGLDGIHSDSRRISSAPMSEIQHLRDKAVNKGSEMLLDREQEGQRDREKYALTHDPNDPQHRLLLPIGVLGLHEPLNTKNDEALKAFQEGNFRHEHRTDPLGRGRDAKITNDELFTQQRDRPLARFSIYPLSEYQQHLDGLKGDYHHPEPFVHGAMTETQIRQELMAMDDEYRNSGETSRGRRRLGERLRRSTAKVDDGKVQPFGTYDGEQYVIAPNNNYLAQEHIETLLEQLRFTKDEDERQKINERINELGSQTEVYQGKEHPAHQRKADMGKQTHDIVKDVFQKLVRPAIEHHLPKIFGHEGATPAENNKAWAMTAYGMHVAEYIAAHLSPAERAQIMTGQSLYFRDNEAQQADIKDITNADDRKALNASRVKRSHFYTKKGDRLKVADTFANTPKGHELAMRLYDGDPRHKSIFEKIVKNVDEAAKEQGISFEDAFASRYLAHERAAESRQTHRPTKIQDGRRGFETVDTVANLIKDPSALHQKAGIADRSSNYPHHDGGIFHANAEKLGVLHGGESVVHNGESLSMQKEFNTLHEVLGDVFNQLANGGDLSILGKGIKHKNRIMQMSSLFPTGSRKDRSKKKHEALRMMAHALNDRTQPHAGANKFTEMKMPYGGQDLNHATLAPLYANRQHQFEHGKTVTLPATVSKDALKRNGHFFINTPDSSMAMMPNNNQMQLVVSRDGCYDVNPDLQPYDYNIPDQYIKDGSVYGTQAQYASSMTDPNILASLDTFSDSTLFTKKDGQPPPVKFMHRIFDLGDMQHLRGFTGDWVISLYPNGEHVIATRKGKKFTAYGANGEVKLDETIVEEVDKVYEKDFTVHAILHDGIMTVIDLLKTADEDTHNMPTKDRIRHLRAQYESSEHIKMPEPINTKRSDDEGLQTAIDGLRKENDEDILLRDANATYMKGEPRHPKWVLLGKEKEVDVIILSRVGKKYTIGVGPLMHPEHYGKRAEEINGTHYMNVGSAKGPRGLKPGDFATVRCTGVSASKGEHSIYRIRSAKLTDNEPLAADSVETLSAMSGNHAVEQNVGMKKGNIIINFPAFDDDVICKTREEEGLWVVEPHSSTWGNEYLVKLARDQEAYWEARAALLLLKNENEEPEYDEVNPEPPAGHSKKPKKVLGEEEEVIKRGLELLERGLEQLSKEKITSTGIQGLGIGHATYDESPRGPTENIRDDTMPDFDPQARRDDELKPATAKKTKRLRSTEGEEATLEDDGVIAIENSSFDIR